MRVAWELKSGLGDLLVAGPLAEDSQTVASIVVAHADLLHGDRVRVVAGRQEELQP